jgi:hypothetical protein
MDAKEAAIHWKDQLRAHPFDPSHLVPSTHIRTLVEAVIALPGDAPPAVEPTDVVTLRDRFAVNAPSEPAQWFEPFMEDPEPEIPQGSEWCESKGLGDKYWEGYQGISFLDIDWIERSQPNLVLEARQFAEGQGSAIRGAGEWRQEAQKRTAVQWPYAYADAVIAADNALKAREKDGAQ